MKDFNDSLLFSIDDWNRTSHKLESKEFGKWELFLPVLDGSMPIQHGSKYKVLLLVICDVPGENQYIKKIFIESCLITSKTCNYQ